MKSATLPIVRQLAYDFPGNYFDYTGTYLIVNGNRIQTFLTAGEIAGHDPVKPNSRTYYQLFCNIVYNHFHIEPRDGSFADMLIIDEEESRKAAISKWFAEKRIAFLDNDGEVTALKYEVEGDTGPLQQISYEEAVEVEPLRDQDAVVSGNAADQDEKKGPQRTPEEQEEWERHIASLKAEGEKIKDEMNKEQQKEENSKKKRKLFRKKR